MYLIKYFDEHGKGFSKTFKTRSSAYAFIEKLDNSIKAGICAGYIITKL